MRKLILTSLIFLSFGITNSGTVSNIQAVPSSVVENIQIIKMNKIAKKAEVVNDRLDVAEVQLDSIVLKLEDKSILRKLRRELKKEEQAITLK